MIENLAPEAEIIVLDYDADEIVQIGEYLDDYRHIEGIHIISQGQSGELFFANTELNQETLPAYQQAIQQWRKSLTEDAEIIFYGCDLNSEEEGADVIQQVDQRTLAEVLGEVEYTEQKDKSVNRLVAK